MAEKTLEQQVACLARSFDNFVEYEHKPLKETVRRLETVLMAPDENNEFRRRGVIVTVMAICDLLRVFTRVVLPILAACGGVVYFMIEHWKL